MVEEREGGSAEMSLIWGSRVYRRGVELRKGVGMKMIVKVGIQKVVEKVTGTKPLSNCLIAQAVEVIRLSVFVT